MFQEIKTSLNKTLHYLLTQKSRNATKAIIATDGTGHYNSIGEAITAGEKYLFIKDGSYNIDEDIIVSDHSIIGESRNNTILNFFDNKSFIFNNGGDAIDRGGLGTKEIKFASSSQLVTKAGSLECEFDQVTRDDSTIFTVNSFLIKVDSITDSDNLNIENIFPGRIDDLSNNPLELFPYNLGNYTSNGAIIENLKINYLSKPASTETNCIEVYGINHIFKDISFISINNDVIFMNFTSNFSEEKICKNILIEGCSFEGGLNAIKLNKTSNLTIKRNDFINQKETIINGENGDYNIKLEFLFNNFSNSFRGVFLENETTDLTFKYNYFNNMEESAIIAKTSLGEEEKKLTIDGNTFTQCGEDNINRGEKETIVTSFNSTSIINNIFDRCQTAVNASYTTSILVEDRFIIKNNQFIECNKAVFTNSDGCLIEANVFKSCEDYNIYATKDSIIQGNQFIEPVDTKPINGDSCQILGNQFKLTSNSQIVFSTNEFTIIGNWFEKAYILISGDRNLIKGNQIRNMDSGFALTISGDKNMISSNIIKNCDSAIDIQATADKTNVLENIWNNITTTTLQNNGTNTVTSNNITK